MSPSTPFGNVHVVFLTPTAEDPRADSEGQVLQGTSAKPQGHWRVMEKRALLVPMFSLGTRLA